MPNEEIAALKKHRATIKGSCTRIKTYVESVIATSPEIVAQLEERKLKLEQYWAEYNAIQTKIELVEESEGADRVSFEEAFYAVSAKARELVLRATTATRAPGPLSPASTSSRDNSETFTHVRLPKLNLPTFSGKYDEWFPFYDTFVSVIHSNVTLSNIQKFQYLRASVTGDAGNVINSLEISDVNYEVAWTLLKQRYDNKRVIVQNHIKAIMELPSMTKENHSDLRKIADGAAKHLHALHALKRPTSHWDDLLVHVLSSKLDPVTLREWQSALIGNDLPTLQQFFDFATHQCQMLEATNRISALPSKVSQSNSKRQSSCAATIRSKCNYCSGDHLIYHCKQFLALPIPRRISEIRNRKICANCLRSTSHVASKCGSSSCRVCQSKHNTLLHASNSASETSERSTTVDETKPSASAAILATHASSSIDSNSTILSTAVVHAFDANGSPHSCRVLLDCGSQANFISRRFLNTLGITSRPSNVTISGVNGTVSAANRMVNLKLQSRVNSYTATIECIVADQVTDRIPAFSLKRGNFSIPQNLKLADPHFEVSSEIDILIGADLFWELLCIGQIKPTRRHPMLQKTRLGWILAGRLGGFASPSSRVQALHASVTDTQLHDQLSRFWQLNDSLVPSDTRTVEENLCEQHFLSNVTQTSQGRYMVKLPIKEHLISRRKLNDFLFTAPLRVQSNKSIIKIARHI